MKQIVMKARYLALLGVVGLLITSVSAFGWGLFETGKLAYSMAVGGSSPIDLIRIADYFLVAVTLLILAASLYELFIGEINAPEGMIVRNLHEFKVRLSGMIVLVMVVKFLEKLYLEGDTGDLVRTAIAVSVISAALIAFSYFGNRN